MTVCKKKSQMRLQSIGEILFATFKRRGLATKLADNAVLKLWPAAVGHQIAAQTQPDCLKNGALFVRTTSSVWVQQLHFMKEDIRKKLNEMAKKEVIKEIRFTVGHELARKVAQANVPLSKKLFLNARDKKMITECTQALPDPELAAIFRRVMQTEISRRRQREAAQVR
jgi:hypothetical protein